MKHLFVGISFFCFSLCSVNAQENSISNIKHEMSFAVSGCTTPLLTKIFFGGSIDMKYYPTHRWGTGLDFSGAQKIINNTYNFDMGTPIINYYEIGWLNQYDFIQTEKFRIGKMEGTEKFMFQERLNRIISTLSSQVLRHHIVSIPKNTILIFILQRKPNTGLPLEEQNMPTYQTLTEAL